MRIQYVKLHNIRSYKDSKIEFKEGSTLLLGDIGSGKSTILLAIEYAIFGFLKSEITGNAILRHGEMSGSVDVCFIIDGKEIIVRRELKRMQDGIIPSKCFLTTNSEIEQLTSTELREKLFEILKYPRSIVSKNPTLIYRYTIYTPQEQLKEIIYDEPEARIDLLRKLFGIDKYKKIINNVDTYTLYLRGKVREYKGQIYDIEELRKQVQEYVEKINILNSNKEKTDAEFKIIKTEHDKVKKEYDDITIQVKDNEKIKKDIEIIEAKIEQNKKQSDKTIFLIDSSKKEILEFETKIDKSVNVSDEKDLRILNTNLSNLESEFNKKKMLLEKAKQRKTLFDKSITELKENILSKQNFAKEKFSGLDEEDIKKTKEAKEALKKETLEKRKETEKLIDEQKKEFFTINALIQKSREVEQKITLLENCPTCLQKVLPEYKIKIKQEEKKRQTEFEEKMNEHKENVVKFKDLLAKIDRTLTELHEHEIFLSKQIEKLSQKTQWTLEIRQLENKQKNIELEIEELEKELKSAEDIEILLEQINKKRKEIELAVENNKIINVQKNLIEKIKIHKDMLSNYEKALETLSEEGKELSKNKETQKIELEKYAGLDNRQKEIQEKLKYHELEVNKKQLEVTTIERDITNNTENLGKLTEKLEYKLNIEKDIEKINKILDFLSPAFSDLMQTIESKIMQKVYTTFNFLFKKWFAMLVEDETIAVRLDENFNPMISQNGYDTTVNNLSGGEKTSLALSYRLSLTKTINEILVNQTTNSLLILDEPTDGFSDMQLDRMRSVLDELEIKQIIIVSHESKIESFVDNIVNVSKKEHVSAIG